MFYLVCLFGAFAGISLAVCALVPVFLLDLQPRGKHRAPSARKLKQQEKRA